MKISINLHTEQITNKSVCNVLEYYGWESHYTMKTHDGLFYIFKKDQAQVFLPDKRYVSKSVYHKSIEHLIETITEWEDIDTLTFYLQLLDGELLS